MSDDHDRLHVWDLTNIGKPKLQKIVNYRHAVKCYPVSSYFSSKFGPDNLCVSLVVLQCLRLIPM